MQQTACRFFWVIMAVAVSTGVILATTGIGNARDFTGRYLGASMGMAHYDIEVDNELSVKGISADGAAFGVFGGFGLVVRQNVYFGMEANLGIHSADYSYSLKNDDDYTEEADVKETYGVTGRVGYVLDNWLIYGLFGWQNVKIDFDTKYQDVDGNIYRFSDDSNFNGFRIGTGVEYQAAANFFIRGEYNYTIYNDETLSDNDYYFDADPNAGKFQLADGGRF